MPNTGYGARNITKDMSVRITAKDNASQTIGKIGNALKAFSTSVIARQLGQAFETAGRKILEFSGTATKMAIDFNRGMGLVQTQAQLGSKAFAKLSSDALKSFSQFPQSADDITNALYDIFSSIDVNGKQAIFVLNNVAKAATAGGTDIQTVARGVVVELNSFQLPIKDTTHLLDIQFQMVRKGVGTYEEFVSALGNATASAHVMNQTVETMSGAIAFMTRNGRTAAQASISLSRAIDQLTRHRGEIKDTLGIDIVDKATGKYKSLTQIMNEMHDVLEKTGSVTGPKLMKALQDMFGAGSIQANRFFRSVIPNIGDFNKMVAAMGSKQVAGQAQKAFDIMKQTPAVQLAILTNHIKAIGIAIGQFFLPGIMKAAGFVQRLLDWIDKLDPSVKTAIARFIVLAGVFLLVSGKLLKLFSILKGFQALMQLSELSISGFVVSAGAMLAVVGLIAVAGFLIIKNWKTVGPFFIKLGKDIMRVMVSTFNALKKWWDQNGKAITAGVMALAKSVGNFLVAAFKTLAPLIPPLVSAFGDILKTVLVVGKILLDLGTTILNKINPALKFLAPLLKDIVEAFIAWKVIAFATAKITALIAAVQTFMALMQGGGIAGGLSMFSTSLQATAISAERAGGALTAAQLASSKPWMIPGGPAWTKEMQAGGAAAEGAAGKFSLLAGAIGPLVIAAGGLVIFKSIGGILDQIAKSNAAGVIAEQLHLLPEQIKAINDQFSTFGKLIHGRATMRLQVLKDIQADFEALVKAGVPASEAIRRINDALSASIPLLGGSSGGLIDFQNSMRGSLGLLKNQKVSLDLSSAGVRDYGRQFLTASGSVTRWQNVMVGTADGLRTVRVLLNANNGELQAWTNITARATNMTGRQTKTLATAIDHFYAFGGVLDAATQKTLQNELATGNLRGAAYTLGAAYVKLGGTFKQNVGRLDAWYKVMKDARGLTIEQTGHIGTLMNAVYKLGGSFTDNQLKALHNALAQGNLKRAVDILNGVIDKAQSKLGKEASAHQQARDAAKDQEVKVNGLAQAMRNYNGIKIVPKRFTALGLDGLISDLNTYITLLNIAGTKSVPSSRRTKGQGVGPSYPKPKQFGGPVEAGMPYIVGERRPELFVPTRAGYIISNLGKIMHDITDAMASHKANTQLARAFQRFSDSVQSEGMATMPEGRNYNARYGGTGREVHLHFHGMEKMDVQDAMDEVQFATKTGGI